MTPLSEQFSQLWSRDLPDDARRALEHRIATEPSVAEDWRRFSAAMDALSALPDAMTPPPLRDRSAAPRAAPRLGWVVPWGLVAAAAVALLWPRAEPTLVLAAGNQWVSGDVRLLAGDATVDVDGKVWVSVEPPAGEARVEARDQEDPMKRSTWLAGVAGAALTVVVYEGTAVVRAEPGAPPVTLGPGGVYAPQPTAPARGAPAETREQTLTRLEEELEAAQRALAEARFAGAVTRGQLVAMQGNPSEWPSDVAPEIGPERYRAELETRLEGMEDVEITEVDCTEYPCIAAVRYTGDQPEGEWQRPIGEAVRAWQEAALPDGVSLSLNTSRFRDGEKDAQFVVFGAHGGNRDSDVGTRTEFRMDALVDDLGQRFAEEQP